MSWFDETLDSLAQQPCCGYRANGAVAVEPTALAAMALIGGGRRQAAERALKWLAEVQTDDGSLGIDASRRQPCWPTGWAVLAWRSATGGADGRRWSAAADKAVGWVLSSRGRKFPLSSKSREDAAVGGWPWVGSTFTWVEPTSINLMALKLSGMGEHARSRGAVEVLLHRMLPSGGWNYGNTIVLGNTLRPHVQPTGLALAALHGEQSAARHVQRSIDYLDRVVGRRTTTASLCYALIGAMAHGHRPEAADRWLEAARGRTLRRGGSPYKLALTVLAGLGSDCPWFADSLVAQQR